MTRNLTRAGLIVLAFIVGVYLLMPMLIVVPISFSDSSFLGFPPENFSLRWYEVFFSDPSWISATLASLRVALLSATCAVVLGVLGALALVRGRFPFRHSTIVVILAPLIVPYVIVGLAVYIAFLRFGLTETTLGFVIVHTALAVPYVLINVAAGLTSVDRRLEMAAMNLGASPTSTFFRITLPIVAPSVLSGALFAFVISWDEVVTAIFISGPGLTTLPVKMWSGIRVQVDPTVAAVSSLVLSVIFLSFLTLFAAGLARNLVRRRSR